MSVKLQILRNDMIRSIWFFNFASVIHLMHYYYRIQYWLLSFSSTFFHLVQYLKLVSLVKKKQQYVKAYGDWNTFQKQVKFLIRIYMCASCRYQTIWCNVTLCLCWIFPQLRNKLGVKKFKLVDCSSVVHSRVKFMSKGRRFLFFVVSILWKSLHCL